MNKKLAILSSRFPYPLTKGDRLRLFYQMRSLSQDFDIYLFCINEDYPTTEAMKEVAPLCKEILIFPLSKGRRRLSMAWSFTKEWPLQVAWFYDPVIAKRMAEAVHLIDPDWVHVHLIRMAPYASALLKDYPKSIDFMDSMVLNDLAGQYLKGWKGLFRSLERKKVKRYESGIGAQFDARFVISERDRMHFPEKERSQMNILMNAVDLEYFRPADMLKEYDLVFCGNLSYAPNIKAVQFIVHELMPSLRDCSCLIVGAEMDASLKALARKNVTISGFVPDIRKAYRSAKILIVPIFSGSGVQNKALEGMALGIPTIVTSFVNKGLDAVVGEEVLVADSKEMFISRVKSLLSHPETSASLSVMGRSFVERNFNWDKNTQILKEHINRALSYE